MWKLTLILLSVLMLTACASGTGLTKAPRQRLPADLAQPCGTLPPVTSGHGGELLQNHVDGMGLLKECAARHDGTVEWIKNTLREE